MKDSKDDIITIVSDYKIIHSNSNKTDSQSGGEAVAKRSKNFSTEESQSIMEYVEEYLERNHLRYPDICPELREAVAPTETSLDVAPTRGNSKKRDISLWADLNSQFPNRKKIALYDHVQNKVMRMHTKNTPWSEDEISRLVSLVRVHGSHWRLIGRYLDRFSGMYGFFCKRVFFVYVF